MSTQEQIFKSLRENRIPVRESRVFYRLNWSVLRLLEGIKNLPAGAGKAQKDKLIIRHIADIYETFSNHFGMNGGADGKTLNP